MNANDIRRFFSTGKLNESLTKKSTLETKSFTEAFDELSRLYEVDEETAYGITIGIDSLFCNRFCFK